MKNGSFSVKLVKCPLECNLLLFYQALKISVSQNVIFGVVYSIVCLKLVTPMHLETVSILTLRFSWVQLPPELGIVICTLQH